MSWRPISSLSLFAEPMNVLRRHPCIRCVFRCLLWLAGGVLAGVGVCVGVAETWTYVLSSGRCHDRVDDCPEESVGLVLGCSKYLARGYRNYYFLGRMEAAANLWKSGRVRCLIVSGDNSSRYYNEPRDMKESLVALGVPEERIVCDYAGVCTYDSVMRAHRIFGAKRLTIVSQPDHVARAVAIAAHLGIEAEGYHAPLLPLSFSRKTRAFLRERGARVAMVYDFITHRTPSYMGERETLPF